jgi:hypothetical protein
MGITGPGISTGRNNYFHVIDRCDNIDINNKHLLEY